MNITKAAKHPTSKNITNTRCSLIEILAKKAAINTFGKISPAAIHETKADQFAQFARRR
jgi:hypothetical protein